MSEYTSELSCRPLQTATRTAILQRVRGQKYGVTNSDKCIYMPDIAGFDYTILQDTDLQDSAGEEMAARGTTSSILSERAKARRSDAAATGGGVAAA